jgi:broad specificity phosphatase PhoE
VRLILVRHGESEWNEAGRVQGQADPGLTARGREEARRLARLVRAERPELVVCSDLRRAADTAALVAGDSAEPDPRWRESAMGDWTGRDVDELWADPAGRFAAWREGRATPPGGETWEQMCARVAAAARDLAARGVARALVVTHGGPVRAACAVLTGLGPTGLVPVPNGSMTVIDLASGRLHALAVRCDT